MKQKLSLAPMGLTVCVLAMMAELQAGPGFTGDYRFTPINLPETTQILAGPNDKNELTGYYLDENGSAHGFLWRKGVVTDLDAPGMVNTQPAGINNHGMIIGNYDDGTTTHAFVHRLHGGKWKELPAVPGKPLSFATGISNNGTIVGYAFEDDFSAEVGWIWDGCSYSFFTLPGVELFIPTAINKRGEVIGYYPEDPADPSGLWHGFLKCKGEVTVIDAPVPGTTGTFPVGLNDKGDIAGTYYGIYDGVFENHGFVIHDGDFLTVDYPGATFTQVTGINARNQLAGFVFDDINPQAFLATPVRGRKP